LSSRISFWFALVCCLGLLVSCGGGKSTPPSSPTLQSISVSPSGASVVAGKTQQFSAQGSYSDGTTKALSGPNWTTSDSTIATISSSGLLTAVKQGSVTVSATSGSVSGSTSATIGAAQLVSIAVSPQGSSLRVNKEEQFVATGTFTDGTMQPLSNVTWSSSVTNFAVIDNTGLAGGASPGVTTIQATSGSISGSTRLTVFLPSAPPFNFVTGQTFSSGGPSPQGIVLADFNGDGKIDIAVSTSDLTNDTNTIAVFLNDGTGNFGAPVTTTVTTPASLGMLVTGDFNEDGKADLVVSQISGGDQANRVLLGNGDGTFSVQPEIKNSFGFLSAVVVDINGDGHQDLVLGMNGPVAISLGKGDGTFVDTVFYQTDPSINPGGFLGINAADFNGDGKIDVVASGYSGYVVFFPGNGDGTLGTAVPMSTDTLNLTAQAVADFDGDGKLDLLSGLVNGAVIYPGHGDGSFDLTYIEFVYSENVGQPNSGGMSLLATDMANSGKPDAVTADFTTGVLQIDLNESLGLIAPANGIFSFSLGAGLNGVAAADLNGDGIKDIAVINFKTGQVATILSQK
jgi:Bacterial Ig-like domain (group 2)/FG-GAP-like repeat